MKTLRVCSSAILSTVLAIVWIFAAAATINASEWHPTNGPYGGGVVALCADATGSVYAARNDEIFRSDDGGSTWLNVSNGEVSANIYCLDVSAAGNLYAGVAFRGVYWSFDSGASWDHDQITHDPHSGLGATIVAIGADNDDVIYAGSFRSLNDGNSWLELGFYGYAFAFDSADNVYAGSSDGVRYSTDHGANWTMLNAGMEDERIVALALNSSDHIFAGTRETGLFRSTDGGLTWTYIGDNLPSLRVEAMTIDSADRIYCSLTNGGLFLSIDSGTTWTAIEAGLGGRKIFSLTTGTSDGVYAGSEYHGVFRSDDQGASWTPRSAAAMGLPGIEDLALAPLSGDLFLAAGGAGMYRSTNDGSDWEECNNGLLGNLVHAVAGDTSGRIYAATEDGMYASIDDGATWIPSNSGHEGNPAYRVQVDDDNNVIAVLAPDVFLFEFSVVRSTDNGATWQELLSTADATFPTTAEALVIDHVGRLFLGGMSIATEGVIFVSDDDGSTWEETTFSAALGVTGLAVDSNDVIYASMGNNDLMVSNDHGTTWTEIPNGGWPNGTVGVLDVVAVDQQDAVLLSSRKAGIWRSTDGGASWVLFDEGLADADYPSVTFLKPAADALFAGTLGDGLFRREATTVAVDPVGIPARFSLLGANPNPFNPKTSIRYELDASALVCVTVHDLAGHLVRTLASGLYKPAGQHETDWDGRDELGRDLPSGIYFASVEVRGIRATGKMILAR